MTVPQPGSPPKKNDYHTGTLELLGATGTKPCMLDTLPSPFLVSRSRRRCCWASASCHFESSLFPGSVDAARRMRWGRLHKNKNEMRQLTSPSRTPPHQTVSPPPPTSLAHSFPSSVRHAGSPILPILRYLSRRAPRNLACCHLHSLFSFWLRLTAVPSCPSFGT